MTKWHVPFSMFGAFVVMAEDEAGAVRAARELVEDGIFPEWEGIDWGAVEPASKWERFTS